MCQRGCGERNLQSMLKFNLFLPLKNNSLRILQCNCWCYQTHLSWSQAQLLTIANPSCTYLNGTFLILLFLMEFTKTSLVAIWESTETWGLKPLISAPYIYTSESEVAGGRESSVREILWSKGLFISDPCCRSNRGTVGTVFLLVIILLFSSICDHKI